MIPTYTYRKNHHDWELTQDGYVLGYIIRSWIKTGQGGELAGHQWRISKDGQSYHGAFPDRKTAREYLQNV